MPPNWKPSALPTLKPRPDVAVDAFDPGPDGTYPHFPRDAQGQPVWADSPTGLPVANGGDPMPRGVQRMRDPGSGRVLLVDVTPRQPNGEPINPPAVPPAAPA